MKVISWAALGAALLCIGCGSETVSSGVSIDRSIRGLLWPEATVLLGANLAELKKTSFYQRHSEQLDLPLLNESSERLGLDPRRDLRTLVLASDGQRLLILAEGQFHEKEIRQKLSGAGARSTDYHSFRLLGDERNSLVLLNDSVAVAGSGPAVRFALDTKMTKGGSVAPTLQSRLDCIPKASPIWLVSSKGLPFTELQMRSDVRSALSNIVSFISGTTASLRVTDGVDLRATLNCVSQEGAKRVHDALRGGIGLARLSTKDDQVDLLRIYDAIKVEQNGTDVDVKAALNGREVDQLIASLQQFRRN